MVTGEIEPRISDVSGPLTQSVLSQFNFCLMFVSFVMVMVRAKLRRLSKEKCLEFATTEQTDFFCLWRILKSEVDEF